MLRNLWAQEFPGLILSVLGFAFGKNANRKDSFRFALFVSRASPTRIADYFDLEDEADQARLENAAFALGSLSGLVVIDEVQRRPDLFSMLRVLLDKPTNKTPFLVLGNASPNSILGPGA